MSVIKTGTTSTTGYIVESDTNGNLVIQTGSTPTTALTLNSNQTATFAQSVNIPNTFGFKNRIINGGMVIDQRNAGASVTLGAGDVYVIDRWNAQEDTDGGMTAQRSTIAPSGFTNSLLFTTTSPDASLGTTQSVYLRQPIEGFNVADLAWGTASAQTVTLSFWVRSSLTGTFGGSFTNSAQNRCYPFTYTISAANTWEQKSVTVVGDTTGTWLTDNGRGIVLYFSLGMGSTYSGTAGAWTGTSNILSATGATSVIGTNGATFYITGVQLERGSTATSFDFRPYGTELALCQRYLPAWNWLSGNDNVGFGYSISTVSSLINVAIPVTPRVAPTGVSTSAMTNFILRNGSNTGGTPTAIAINVTSSGVNQSLSVTTSAGAPTLIAGQGAFLFANGAAQILFTGCEL